MWAMLLGGIRYLSRDCGALPLRRPGDGFADADGALDLVEELASPLFADSAGALDLVEELASSRPRGDFGLAEAWSDPLELSTRPRGDLVLAEAW